MNKFILGIAVIAVALAGCEPKEKIAALQHQVDSLNVQLDAHIKVEKSINEVGAIIDSIDINRHALQLKMIEGNSASDYLARLKNINEYVKRAESMILALDKSKVLNNANKKSLQISNSTIRGLKADLEKQSQEILTLQLQIAKLSDENLALWLKVNQRDSILLVKDQVIVFNKNDIATLEKQSIEVEKKNRIAVANLYFDQASAVEKIADHTQFAPKKRRATRMWALDLYKLSQSLGNKEAQFRIQKLEKKLS